MPLQDTASAPARASGLERFGEDVARAIRARECELQRDSRYVFRHQDHYWIGDGCFAVRTSERVDDIERLRGERVPLDLKAMSAGGLSPIMGALYGFNYIHGWWLMLRSAWGTCCVAGRYHDIVRRRSASICVSRLLSSGKNLLLLVGLDHEGGPTAIAMPLSRPYEGRTFPAFPHLPREAAQRLGEHLQLQGGSWS